MDKYQRLKYALENTRILRQSKLYISTFISTELPYYLLTEAPDDETELRKGCVIVEKPMIIIPQYIAENYFEGFGDDQLEYLQTLMLHPAFKGLGYRYKNVDKKIELIDKGLNEVLKIVDREIKRENKYAGIIHGVLGLWGISLMKYVLGVIGKSFPGNIQELQERGFI